EAVIVRRQGSGIYVSPRIHQTSIGLVLGRQAFQPGASPFCAMLVDECQRRAQSLDQSFSFFIDLPPGEATEGQPVHADLHEAVTKRRLDGVLLANRHSEAQEAWLREQGVPVVSFAGGVVEPMAPCSVGFDLQAMAALAARELASRGCRRVAMIA